MRRLVAVLLLMTLICTAAFAMGGAEDTSVQEIPDSSQVVESSSPIRNFLNGLADIFDNITLMACINVNPFPSMLLESGYSNATSIFNTKDGPSSMKEKTIASTIGAIFISCIIAEILYIAVFKCFLLGEAAIVKQVASVFLRGMVLFFIVINLPVIIELTRTGLQEIAYTIAGSKVSADSSLAEMRDNVFKMPGTLIRSSIDVIDLLDPNNAGGVGISVVEAAADGAQLGLKTLTGLLVQILYWVVQLICVICLCVASLHVMFNIVEVYLLIGIVAILAPFQIFDPTRWLGERAINSLFVNLVELFILMVILYSCFAVLAAFQEWISEAFINQMKTGAPVEYQLNYNELMPKSEYDMLAEQAANYNISGLPGYGYEGYEYSFNSRRANQSGYYQNEAKITGVMEKLHIMEAKRVLTYGNIIATPADASLVNEIGGKIYWNVSAINAAAQNGTLLEILSVPSQIRVNTQVLADNPLLAKYAIDMTQYSVNTDIVPVHLSSALISVLMLFYFVGQSSQVTNALIAGTAATTGFEGAMMKMGAAKGIAMAGSLAGGGVKVGGLAARGIVGGVKGLGNSGKTASQHVSNMASTIPITPTVSPKVTGQPSP